MKSVQTSRSILIHYHLFKNAGTSIERLLRQSFGANWKAWDKPDSGGKISALELQQWLEAHKNIRAVSSHQFMPPFPRGDFHVIPIVFLREPLSRVRSAWLFEWQIQLKLAKPKGTLAEYIEEKFKHKNSSVIANFQVSRLSNERYDETRQRLNRYNHELLPAAMRFVDSLPFVGLVERFSESLQLLEQSACSQFPDLVVREHRENVTDDSAASVESRIDSLRREIGNQLFDELCMRNALDLQLYRYAAGRFASSIKQLNNESNRQDQRLVVVR